MANIEGEEAINTITMAMAMAMALAMAGKGGVGGRSCGEKEVELRVLVRGVAVQDPKLYDPETADLYERFDYYEVDLNHHKSGQVLVPCCDPLGSNLGAGGTLKIKSKIYTVGYLFRPVDDLPDSVEYMGESVDVLKCVAYVDLNDDHPRKWKQAAPPPLYGLGIEPAVLGDNLYCLGSVRLDEPLVYVPDEDKWSLVSDAIPPTQFHECFISQQVFPDPSQDRILLHLSGNGISPGLYAWYPHRCASDPDSDDSPPPPPPRAATHNVESTDSNYEFPDNSTDSPASPLLTPLECVRRNLTSKIWRKKTTFAQGMLFFFSRKFEGLVKVLDLATNNWLQVEWSSPPPTFSYYQRARSMFYMGNGHLCLALNSVYNTPCYGTRIYFDLFHFRRLNDFTITISHRFSKFFDAHGLRYADDFVPLGDVCG